MRLVSLIGQLFGAVLLLASPFAAVAQMPEESASLPAAPAVSQLDAMTALDNAMAGARLVEASELLDRLEAISGPVRAPELVLLRAEWLIAVGRPAEALPRLAVVGSETPLRCRVMSARAMALLATAVVDEASSLLAATEEPCGNEPVYWRVRARLELLRGHAEDAVPALRRAVALEPESFDVLSELAVALVETDAAAAARLLTVLAKREPSRSDIRLNLDFARGMLGEPPTRIAGEDDMFWSRRLQFAGLGARRASHSRLAEAMLGQALLVRPRHDAELWQQYREMSDKEGEGQTLAGY